MGALAKRPLLFNQRQIRRPKTGCTAASVPSRVRRLTLPVAYSRHGLFRKSDGMVVSSRDEHALAVSMAIYVNNNVILG
jgi:hypothetical protein